MFDGVKVFCATLGRERQTLGETVTTWMRENKATSVETMVVQSSDATHHCLTVVVFYTR